MCAIPRICLWGLEGKRFQIVNANYCCLFFKRLCIMRLYVLSSIVWCPLRFPHKNDVRFFFTSSCPIYVICVCLRIVVSVIYCVVPCAICCQFLWIVHFRLPLRYSLTCMCLLELLASSDSSSYLDDTYYISSTFVHQLSCWGAFVFFYLFIYLLHCSIC